MEALRLIDDWPGPAAVVVRDPTGVVAERGDGTRPGRWASVTKLFTSYGALIARENSLIDLDEPLGPEGSTVRHLLAHASGLPFEGRQPIAAPGRKRIYSNEGMDLIGDLLAARSGRYFDEVLAEMVLTPLDVTAHLDGRPSEGLVGDLDGLSAFLAELMSPRLLVPASVTEAKSVAFPGLAGTLPGVGRFDPLDWGLGFEIRGGKQPHWTGTSNSAGTFGHFGGSGSFLWFDPDLELGVAGLSHAEFGPWALAAWPELFDAIITERSR